MPPSSFRPPASVCVVDTQILISLKNRLRVNEQWPMLRHLDRLVEEGWVTFPKQVARELEIAQHPDGPGIWAVAAKDRRRYAEPSDDSMAEVLGVAPGLLDPNEERNQADPYVVALAYELSDQYPEVQVHVATENTVDRGDLTSPATACERLQLSRLNFRSFIEWIPALDDASRELVYAVLANLVRQEEPDGGAGT